MLIKKKDDSLSVNHSLKIYEGDVACFNVLLYWCLVFYL